MPLVYRGRLEMKYENLIHRNAAGREAYEARNRRLEQMDNDEAKRQELAVSKYKSMRGLARQMAIVEEIRKKEEYLKQRQCLFPQTRATVELLTTLRPTLEARSSSNVKGKQRADPENLEPTDSLVAAQTTSHGDSTVSTNRPSDTSRLSPASSTSSPPSLQRDNRSKTIPTMNMAKDDYIPMSTKKHRLHGIPPWFFVDRACAAYATPVPDLKAVMELGVLHAASVMS